jgi:hypothetical protein
MASIPTQFDVKLTASSSERYKGAVALDEAKRSGDIEENTKGLRKIKLVLRFPTIEIIDRPSWP